MKGRLVSAGALCLCACTAASGAPIVVEPFDYSAGTSLIGQTPSTGFAWGTAASSTPDDLVINAGSMSPAAPYTLPAGFPAPTGGSVTYGGQGRTYVQPLGAITTGTTYYSMLVNVRDLGVLTGTTPGIMAGLANASI